MSKWKQFKLSDFIHIKHGFAFSGEYITTTPSKHILITPGNFKIGGGFKRDKYKYFTGEIPEDFILHSGDLVVTMTDLSKDTDTLGYSAFIPSLKNHLFLHNQRIGLIELVSKGIDKQFLYWLLRTFDYREYILGTATGTSVQHTSPSRILDYTFDCPTLQEQRAIASVLSNLDDKIDLLHRQNATLEAMAEALFKKWFVVEAKDEWGEIQLEEVITIHDSKRIPLSQLERDKMKNGYLYPYYGAAQIMDYIDQYIFDGDYLLLAEDGTVRTESGFPILQRAYGKFWVNNHTHILQAKSPYTNDFLYIYLLKFNIDKFITGAVQPKISQSNLKKIPFFKYPNELIFKFNTYSKSYFDKTRFNLKQIDSLTKLRDTLLPKLMSGEVRVKY